MSSLLSALEVAHLVLHLHLQQGQAFRGNRADGAHGPVLQKVLVDHVQDRKKGGCGGSNGVLHRDPRLLVGLYRVVREHRDVLHDGGPLSHSVVGHERWGLVGGEKRQELRLVPHDLLVQVAPRQLGDRVGELLVHLEPHRLTPVHLPDAHKPSGAAKRIDGGGCVGVANLGERGGIDGHRVRPQDGTHQVAQSVLAVPPHAARPQRRGLLQRSMSS